MAGQLSSVNSDGRNPKERNHNYPQGHYPQNQSSMTYDNYSHGPPQVNPPPYFFAHHQSVFLSPSMQFPSNPVPPGSWMHNNGNRNMAGPGGVGPWIENPHFLSTGPYFNSIPLSHPPRFQSQSQNQNHPQNPNNNVPPWYFPKIPFVRLGQHHYQNHIGVDKSTGISPRQEERYKPRSPVIIQEMGSNFSLNTPEESIDVELQITYASITSPGGTVEKNVKTEFGGVDDFLGNLPGRPETEAVIEEILNSTGKAPAPTTTIVEDVTDDIQPTVQELPAPTDTRATVTVANDEGRRSETVVVVPASEPGPSNSKSKSTSKATAQPVQSSTPQLRKSARIQIRKRTLDDWKITEEETTVLKASSSRSSHKVMCCLGCRSYWKSRK